MVAVEEWRECRECQCKCPLDTHHFQPTRKPVEGKPMRFRRVCRQCESRRAVERDKELRADPKQRREYLRKRAESNRRWLAKNPEKKRRYNADKPSGTPRKQMTKRQREKARRRERRRYRRDREAGRQRSRIKYERIKSDPERWEAYKETARRYREANAERISERRCRWYADNRERILKAHRELYWRKRDEYLELRRIDRALKAEREGREYRSRAAGPRKREPRITFPVVEPLAAFIERLANAYGQLETAAMAGVDAKIIRQIIARNGTLTLTVADQICTRMGFNLFDFWPEEIDE